jgi:hypothetical protein
MTMPCLYRPSLALALALAAVLWPAVASAQVERFAVLAGNDRGQPDELELAFAESDADKMSEVLVDLGGFRPENVVLLRGSDAGTFRRTLISINQRIRARVHAGSQITLLVYYSGHADERALHLGSSELPLAELEDLVGGSAADFRLLIVDACRSGALTRAKGGRSAPAFAIELDDRLSGEGAVYLTSTAANEDAQESSELRGSFFTHYLVSGMLGAADANGDGQVVLSEAYRYAYEHTVRASSRTMAGMQHPSFRYSLAGQGDIVLTRPAAGPSQRTRVRFPAGRTYLLFRGGESGAVVAEVGHADRRRTLSVKPGRYFVRARAPRHLLEGMIDVPAGAAEVVVENSGLERIEYARLVRKGGTDLHMAHAVEAGARLRTAIHEGASPCAGAFAGYRVDYAYLALAARLGACRSTFDNRYIAADSDELDLGLRLVHVRDWAPIGLEIGVDAGASLLTQRFDTTGTAPSRTSAAAYVGAGAGVSLPVWRGLALALEVSAQTYFFSLAERDRSESLASRFSLRGGLALQQWF